MSATAAILKIYFALRLLNRKANCLKIGRKYQVDLQIKIAKIILIANPRWPPSLIFCASSLGGGRVMRRCRVP